MGLCFKYIILNLLIALGSHAFIYVLILYFASSSITVDRHAYTSCHAARIRSRGHYFWWSYTQWRQCCDCLGSSMVQEVSASLSHCTKGQQIIWEQRDTLHFHNLRRRAFQIATAFPKDWNSMLGQKYLLLKRTHIFRVYILAGLDMFVRAAWVQKMDVALFPNLSSGLYSIHEGYWVGNQPPCHQNMQTNSFTTPRTTHSHYFETLGSSLLQWIHTQYQEPSHHQQMHRNSFHISAWKQPAAQIRSPRKETALEGQNAWLSVAWIAER